MKMTVLKDKIIIKHTVTTKFFYVFAFLMAVSVAGFSYLAFGGNFMFWSSAITVVIVSGRMYQMRHDKFTFDKISGLYYTGKEFKKLNVPYRHHQGKLNDIYAIQLFSKQMTSTSSQLDTHEYTCYMLNLMFKGGGRLNVMSHTNEAALNISAKHLAKFLGIPILQPEY